MADRKVSVVLTDRAKSFLAEKGYDPRLGARLSAMATCSRELLRRNYYLLISPGQQIQIDAPRTHQIYLQDNVIFTHSKLQKEK